MGVCRAARSRSRRRRRRQRSGSRLGPGASARCRTWSRSGPTRGWGGTQGGNSPRPCWRRPAGPTESWLHSRAHPEAAACEDAGGARCAQIRIRSHTSWSAPWLHRPPTSIREPPVSGALPRSVPGTRRACGAPLPAGLRRASQQARPFQRGDQSGIAAQHVGRARSAGAWQMVGMAAIMERSGARPRQEP